MNRSRPLPLLNEARDRYCDEAAQKHIRVEVSAFADLSVVNADRRALRSIFDNLLSNAIRYTPPDGEILLAAEEIKNFVQFTVRDSGRGIEADRLGNIFDRFNAFSETAPAWVSLWSGAWSSRSAARSPSKAAWDTEPRFVSPCLSPL